MKKFFAVAIILFPIIASAQDDFPTFAPGIEPWNLSPVPTVNPQFDYNAGLAPSRDSSQFLYVTNPKGATIRVRYVLEWWGLGPLSTSVMSSNASNARWAGPDTRQGQWRGWCLSCEIDMEAGDDNIALWIDYIGSSQFGAHLELIEVIPPAKPPFSILPPWSKQTYHNVGNFLQGFGTGNLVIAPIPCLAGDAFSCIALNATGVLTILAGGLLLQVDPWDDNYAYACDASFPSADDLGVSYLGQGRGGWLDSAANDNDTIVDSGIAVTAYLNAANCSVNRATSCNQIDAGCDGWQAERALEFFEAANSNACNVAGAMWDLASQYEQQGFGSDYSDVWNNEGDGFWEMCNNGVR